MNALAQQSEVEIEIRKLRQAAGAGARKSQIAKKKAAAAKAKHKKARKLAKQARKAAKQAAREASDAKKALGRAVKSLSLLKRKAATSRKKLKSDQSKAAPATGKPEKAERSKTQPKHPAGGSAAPKPANEPARPEAALAGDSGAAADTASPAPMVATDDTADSSPGFPAAV